MSLTMPMPTVDLPQRLLSIKEYNAMIKAGILTEDDKVELLEGRIVATSPSGESHADPIAILNELLVKRLDESRQVRPQLPVELGERSVPEPDLAIVNRRGYRDRHPNDSDVLVVIEVAVSSTRKDREVKAPIYARAGIPEYWMVLPEQSAIEVYRDPRSGRYTEMRTYFSGETVDSVPAPEVAIKVSDILGD